MSSFAKLLSDLLQAGNQRVAAEQSIEQARQANLPQFLLEMCRCLLDESLEPATRRMAAVMFKNAVSDPKSAQRNRELANAWSHIPETQREQLKALILPAFGSNTPHVRSGAAQIIAQLACIEIPLGRWLNIIELLLEKVKMGDQNTKVSTLECLGILCQQINPAILEKQSTLILNTIVSSFENNPPIEVCREAMKALLGALQFVRSNFENKQQRDYVINFICQGAKAGDMKVRRLSVECMVMVASHYYEYLKAYIGPFYEITTTIIKKDVEEIAMQAIEFWSTLSETESALQLEIEENLGEVPQCHYIMAGANGQVGAYSHLVPLLFEALTKQNEDPEDTELCLAICAAACLQLLAETVGSPIVSVAMQFVKPMIQSPDWRQREAAAMGFGCVMFGFEGEEIERLVEQGMSTFIGLLATDPHLTVRDTSAWSLSRMAEFHPTVVEAHSAQLIEALGAAILHNNSHLASMACNALSKAIVALAEEAEDETILEGNFIKLMQVLAQTTDRPDSADNNLRLLAFEAMSNLVEYVPESCLESIFQLVPVFAERLEKTVNLGGEEAIQLQSFLSTLLQFMTNRLQGKVGPHAQRLQLAYFAVLRQNNGAMIEETLDALSALVTEFPDILNACHADMQKIIVTALQKWNETSVLVAGLGLLSAFLAPIPGKAHSMDQGAFLNAVVGTLLQNLKRPLLADDAKPAIIAAFGDVATGAGAGFANYLTPTMQMLATAAGYRADMNDDDKVDHMIELRENLLEAYEMILVALNTAGKADLFKPYIVPLFNFMHGLWTEKEVRTEDIVCHIVGILGDVASTYGKEARELLSMPIITNIINEAALRDGKIKRDARYARREIERALMG